MLVEWLSPNRVSSRSRTKRSLSGRHLSWIASLIVLSILAVSAYALVMGRQRAWQEAEKSSANIVSTLSHEIISTFELLDALLGSVIQGTRYPGLERLSPDVQHQMLFDRATSATFVKTIVILDRNGDLVADGGPVIAPRPLNYRDQEFFKVHEEHPLTGLYISHPYKSTITPGEISIAVSRRLTNPEGGFAGVVAAITSLSAKRSLFESLDLGKNGSIALFRNDGILLLRNPLDERQIGQDFSNQPMGRPLIQDISGSFEGVSAIDGIERYYTFAHVEGFPLILMVSRSVDDILASSEHQALLLCLVTLALCSAVVSLLVLFQRELRRRTKAETKLERIARTDELTGLPNRRAFREAYNRAWRRAARVGSPLSVLFIDADYFKFYNDKYGHGRGDDVLRAVAGILESNIERPMDMAARYGGEEFVIVLPDTDLRGARHIAEAICQGVPSLGIVHEGNPYGVVTVSIGVATALPTRGSKGAPLLEAADAALYEAKAAGRNRVSVSGPIRPERNNLMASGASS